MWRWSEKRDQLEETKSGIVGQLKSILESLVHAGSVNETRVNVHSIHSEHIDENINGDIKKLDGLIVAPGFGSRGIEGKIKAIKGLTLIISFIFNQIFLNIFRTDFFISLFKNENLIFIPLHHSE